MNMRQTGHFFLSQYFRDIYDEALKNLPVVSSGINIERIEVWVTNKTSRFEEASNRNIVAFMDLAENANSYLSMMFLNFRHPRVL